MKFCSLCGAMIVQRIPDDDSRLRYVCDAHHAVHYQNPRIIIGSLPVWDDQILLCRRAIVPHLGYQTLPAGFMRSDEILAQAATRETEEEANARIGDLQLCTLLNLPHVSQVYLFFRAELLDLDFSAGGEGLEVRLFDEAEIPWSELAFPTVGRALEYYFSDRRKGRFPVRNEVITPMLASYKKD